MNEQNLSDSALLRRYALNRDEAAFTELVDRHLPLVFSAAVRKLGTDSAAEDVAQGVFVELAKQARRLVDHPVLAGWLYTTTSRMASDFFRRHARRQNRE